jgi:RNA polymerase sigma-70 factor (ECF subfamily)
MASLETFQAFRPRLLSIAYRMLGSSADAQDAVQEAWLRWQAVDESQVRQPLSWLSTAVSRLCLDKLKALRVRRDAYTGPWLPEPVVTESPVDRESISLAFLVVLERLTPSQRAAYLLHRVFDYSHAEIAETLNMSEAAVRQAVHRAAEHIADNRPRFAPSAEEHTRLLNAFAQAVVQGDMTSLTRLLAEDATLHADGGGKVKGAASHPLHGRERVARFLAGLARKLTPTDQTFELSTINGWPALVGRSQGKVNAIINIETDGEHILAVRNVVNPDKLGLLEVN